MNAPIIICLKHLIAVFPHSKKLIDLSILAHTLGCNKYSNKQNSRKDLGDPDVRLIQSIPLGKRHAVIEIGCGTGSLLSCLINHNVFDTAVGIEHPCMQGKYDYQNGISVEYFDLESEESINRVIKLFKKNAFDLAICTKVAEHLRTDSHSDLIKFCEHLSSYVIFSSPIEGNRAAGHISCKDPQYWLMKFAKSNFPNRRKYHKKAVLHLQQRQ